MGKATCNWGSARSEIKWAHFYGQRRGGGGGGARTKLHMGWATMVGGPPKEKSQLDRRWPCQQPQCSGLVLHTGTGMYIVSR